MSIKKNAIVHLILFIVAFFAVIGIAHQTTIEVQNKDDLRTISCGWPFKFVTNDQSWRDPPYPWTITCLSGEWGDIPTVWWQSFVIDVIAFYFSFVLLWKGYRLTRKEHR